MKKLTITKWDLPHVEINVHFEKPSGEPDDKELKVNVDDLIPARSSSDEVASTHPVDKATNADMIRIPDIDTAAIYREWASSQLQALIANACACGIHMSECIETVLVNEPTSKTPYVPRDGLHLAT